MAKKVADESAKVPSWMDGEYPFDSAKCGVCLTGHTFDNCKDPKHAVISKALRQAAGQTTVSESWAESHLAICLKLRKRLARFYPKASKP